MIKRYLTIIKLDEETTIKYGQRIIKEIFVNGSIKLAKKFKLIINGKSKNKRLVEITNNCVMVLINDNEEYLSDEISYGFRVIEDKFEEIKDFPKRTIYKAELYDIKLIKDFKKEGINENSRTT